MDRRAFLTTGAVSLSVVAGCLGGGDGDGGSGDGDGPGDGGEGTETTTPWSGYSKHAPTDGDTDGYPPEFDRQPAKRDVDASSFATVEEGGVQVPLAPIDAAHYWYRRGEARFVDARGPGSYEAAHVLGAVLSPAPKRYRAPNDPVREWPEDDRIVCYCGCPHHLSSIRASQLISSGYENVFVIDEGFGAWRDRGYPMAGSEVSDSPAKWTIRGETAASLAGENAWARHRPTEQVESTDIADDGSYELHLKFHDIGSDSVIEVETPEYTVEGALEDLTSGTVRG